MSTFIELHYESLKNITSGATALQVIDFEYSGYNPRAFDIANHFCEVNLIYMPAVLPKLQCTPAPRLLARQYAHYARRRHAISTYPP